ncbi:MAG: peptidyl-prolyl cis-trans isomerase [Polyangiaceae bacterium]|nr:peptidyl-prolyl cis-trans isomerase [Polyangiaceae bacterium]
MSLSRKLPVALICGALLSQAEAVKLDTRPAHAAVVERVVAVVGKKAILLSDVKKRSVQFLVRVYAQVPEGPQRAAAISQVYTAVLDQMVTEELEDLAATEAGITVSAEELDRAQKALAEQNGISEGQLLAEAKRSGLDVIQYREDMRRQVLRQKLQGLRLRGRIRVTENDIREAYQKAKREERLQLSQRTALLVLPVGSTSKQKLQQRRLAQKIINEAKQGADFRDLIQKYSAPGSGLAPLSTPAQQLPALQRASLNLEVGEISTPIPLNQHLVLLQLLERAPSQIPSYDELKIRLEQQVQWEKITLAYKRWLDGLRKRTHVDIRL